MATFDDVSSEALTYDPLPTATSIRLLRRLGKTSNGILNFALDTVDLQDQPKYHCLSYTWGNPHANGVPFREDFERVAEEYSPKNLIPILVNGKTLQIRLNLHEALCQLPTEGWISGILNRPHPETMRTRLHDMAEAGEGSIVRGHIIAGANIHARDTLARSPLHCAASNGHLETVKVLVKAGADVEAVDEKQKTAKDLALENGHPEMADLLTEFGDGGGQAILDAVADFSEPGPDDCIWIDAICIDQANLEERSAQVAIMDSIYFSGRYLIAWLGRKDRHTDAALETLAKLDKAGHNFSQSDIMPYRTYTQEDYRKFGLPYISQLNWNALASLFLRRWFRRAWVFQEVIFASGIVVYCGDRQIKWDDLGHVMMLLHSRYVDIGNESSKWYVPLSDIATSVEYFLKILYSYRSLRFELEDSANGQSRSSAQTSQDHSGQILQDSWSLMQLILASFPFHATDPRDKIFALYALSKLNPDTRLKIQPDYKESVEKLYSEVTKSIIESRVDLQVLSWVQNAANKKIGQLPSWVPDYSLQGTGPLRSSRFKACGSLKLTFGSQFYFSPWNELLLKGVVVDVVDRTANARLSGGPYGKFELDPSWFDLLLSFDTTSAYQHTGQPISEVLWRTLCADTVSPNNETTAPPECGVMFKTLICAMVSAEPEHQARIMANDRENAVRLAGLLAAAIRVTRSGNDAHVFVEPDENETAHQRSKFKALDTSLQSSIFDSVRHTLVKLDKLAASEGGANIPTSYEVEAYFKLHNDPITSPDGGSNIPRDTTQFAIAHSNSYGGRRLFATSKGYLGLGPASLDVDDTLWILPGANLPFLMRDVAAAGNDVNEREVRQLKLVGGAYVHGIMNGEAVDESKDSVELQEIKLL